MTFWILAMVCAVAFSWPIIVRYFQIPGQYIALLVPAFSGVIAISNFVLVSGITNGGASRTQILAGIGAGVINGIGTVCYAKLLTNGMDVSRVSPIVSGLMHATTFLGSVFILRESAEPRKILGILLILASVLLLQRPR